MKLKAKFSIIFLLIVGNCFTQVETATWKSNQDSVVLSNMPKWVIPVLEKNEIAQKYKILYGFNPYYFEADFNDDKLIDIVFFVENTIDHSKGLLFVNSGKNNVYIVGCGNPTEMGSSLSWASSWLIYRDKLVRNATKKSITLTAPALLVKSTTDTNLIIYWSGSKYKTFGQIY